MKYKLTIFFDNPITRWQYANRAEVPIIEMDILHQRIYRFECFALGYARVICKHLHNVKYRIDPVEDQR